MATHESFQESSHPIKYKKLVLRVSIDCEGCRKRVNKILSKVPGVQEVDVNLKQQKVTIFGDLDAGFLLKKLRKSGRQVELLPEMKQETVASKQPGKTKDKEKQPKKIDNEETCRPTAGCNNDVKLAGMKTLQKVKLEAPEEIATTSKTAGSGDGGCDKSSAKSGEKNLGDSASEVIEDSLNESKKSEPENESKSKGKKPAGEHPPLAAEQKHVKYGENSTTEKVDSGNIGKKSKKGGQNVNKPQGLSSSESDAATDNGVYPPIYSHPANHILPRDHGYYGYPPNLYTSPPVYAASYNTSHASSSTTTSYYAQPPVDSYVSTHTGLESEPTQSDLDAYNRQPLDSLEMFSDENPNGCSIM